MSYRLENSRLPGNPVVQFVSLIVAGLVAVGAVLLGAVLLSLFLGVAVIVGLGVYIRLWWLRRRMRGQAPRPSPRPGEFVEVEYTVVEERDPLEPRR